MADFPRNPAEHAAPRKPSRLGWYLVGVALAAVGGIVYWQLSQPEPPAPIAEVPPPPPPAAPAPLPAPPPLPPVAEADEFARSLAGAFSKLPAWAQWLKAEDLIRRFVTATYAVAEGTSPRQSLAFAGPEGELKVIKRSGKLYLDPKSYGRYDLFAEVIGSLDSAAVAGAYQKLSPLFESAYREIGPPNTTFAQALSRAVQRLTSVPAVEGEIELTRPKVLYVYARADLEKLPAAGKHLLRMGPRNMGVVQRKLAEIAGALNLPPAVSSEKAGGN